MEDQIPKPKPAAHKKQLVTAFVKNFNTNKLAFVIEAVRTMPAETATVDPEQLMFLIAIQYFSHHE